MQTDFRFSVDRLKKIKPTSKREIYRDTGLPGLSLRVTSKGKRVFFVRLRVKGIDRRITIGPFDDAGRGGWNVEQARRKAAEILTSRGLGEDPDEEGRQHRNSPTMWNLWLEYKDHCATRITARSLDNYGYAFEGHCRPIFQVKACDVTEDQLRRLHDGIGRESKCSANVALGVISRLLRMAKIQPNPAHEIELYGDRGRDRILSPKEISLLFQSLDVEDELWRDFFQMGLYTGARFGNIKAMRWDNLDTALGLWTIPSAESKNRTPLVVPLSDRAMGVLTKRQALRNGSQWVYPSSGAKSGHVEQYISSWARICRRVGLEGITPHDLRRTVGTRICQDGHGIEVAQMVLGHRSLSSTRIYARLAGHDKVVRAAIEGVSNGLEADYMEVE